jgi:hypothetical protein
MRRAQARSVSRVAAPAEPARSVMDGGEHVAMLTGVGDSRRALAA